jgi:hypothetical protein
MKHRLHIAALALLCALSAGAANLVPNSSFELGASRGVQEMGSGSGAAESWGRTTSPDGQLSTDATHGAHSWMPWRSYSRAIYLTNGGNYVLSFDAKRGTTAVNLRYEVSGQARYATTPSNSIALTTNWTRYHQSITAPSNGFYKVQFYGSTNDSFIDSVLLEPGTDTNTFAPQTIECGLTVDTTNRVWFAGDGPTFTLNFWNEGEETNVTAKYSVLDWLNDEVLSGKLNVTLAAGTNTTQTVDLSSVGSGWFRVVNHIVNIPDSMDECTLAIYPFALNTNHDATTWIGGHGHGSPYFANREMMVGRKTSRLLSPAIGVSRWSIVEPTDDAFSFQPEIVSAITNAGSDVIIPLTDSDFAIGPQWATNSGEEFYHTSRNDYISNTVAQYKGERVWWEIGPNESYQSATTTLLNSADVATYVTLLTNGIAAVLSADPNANIIAMSGAGGGTGGHTWAWQVWTNLPTAYQDEIDVLSCHIYSAANDFLPTQVDWEWKYNNSYGKWMDTFGATGKPIWDTESGTWHLASHKTLNGLWPGSYNLTATYTNESYRDNENARHAFATSIIPAQALRARGYGVERWIYYDSRYPQTGLFSAAAPYAADHTLVDHPHTVALSIAQYMVQTGFGKVTNLTTEAVEAFAFTNSSGQPVIAAWSCYRTNYSLSLSNSSFAIYDMMGNLTASNQNPIVLGRWPQYFVTDYLTMDQFTNTVKYGTATLATDTTAPEISIDIAPTADWSDGQLALLKWTAIDNFYHNWNAAGAETNILFGLELDSTVLLSGSQSNHYWLSGVSGGNHKITVTATDGAQNTTTNTYWFGSDPRRMRVNTLKF